MKTDKQVTVPELLKLALAHIRSIADAGKLTSGQSDLVDAAEKHLANAIATLKLMEMLPDDLFSHKDAWHAALAYTAKMCIPPPSSVPEDRYDLFWQQEVQAFDRTWEHLESLRQPNTDLDSLQKPAGAYTQLLIDLLEKIRADDDVDLTKSLSKEIAQVLAEVPVNIPTGHVNSAGHVTWYDPIPEGGAYIFSVPFLQTEALISESRAVIQAISELAAAMGNPAVRADLSKGQSLSSETIRLAAQRVRDASPAPGSAAALEAVVRRCLEHFELPEGLRNEMTWALEGKEWVGFGPYTPRVIAEDNKTQFTIQYMVQTANDSLSLARAVENHRKSGWELQGGVSITAHAERLFYCQALTREVPHD